MKYINDYIVEKFKINSKNIKNKKYLEPEEVEGPETPGIDYWNEEITIIGWPFQEKNDENYKKTKEYIRKSHYQIWNDYEEIDEKDMFDWFCYAVKSDEGSPGSEKEVNCYVYGTEGAIALNK